jgi:hypothetical protein
MGSNTEYVFMEEAATISDKIENHFMNYGNGIKLHH